MSGPVYKDKQAQKVIQTQQQTSVTPVSPQLAEKLQQRRAVQIAHREEAIQQAQQLNKFRRRSFIAPPVDDEPSPQAIEAFYQPGQDMLDRMTATLENMEETATSQDYANMIAQAAGDPLATDRLTQLPHAPACLQPLGELMTQLQSCDPANLTSEQTTAMLAAYRAMDLDAVAPSHRYLDEMEHMDPHSAYVLLYHCVALAMEHVVEGLPPESVDQTAFSKLYGLAAASGLAAGSLCHKRYMEDLKKRLAAEEQQRREETRIHQSKLDYLATGISAEKGAPAHWILGQYSQIVIRALGEEGMQLPWKEFALAVERIRSRLEDRNLPALERALDLAQEQQPGMVLIRQQVLTQVKRDLDLRLAADELEDMDGELNQIIAAALESQRESLDLYAQQKAQLLGDPQLSLLKDALDDWLVQNTSLDQALFQTRFEQLSAQAEENMAQAREIMQSTLSSAATELLLAKLTKLESGCLLNGSPAEITALVQRSLSTLQGVAPEAAHAEDTFRAVLRDAGVQARWFKLADRRINDAHPATPTEMRAVLHGLQARINENLDLFDAYQPGLLLGQTAWKELDSWCMEHMDQPAHQFRTDLEEKLSSLRTGTSEAPVSREQALYTQAGDLLQAPAQEEQGIIQQRLLGEDLCSWPGFGGLYEGYADHILTALEHLLRSQGGEIATLKDLDTLPRSESTSRILQWRSRLAQVAQPWSELNGAQAELVRRRLLPGILKGEVHAGNCAQMAQGIQDQILKENTAQDLRFRILLGSPSTAEEKPIRYRYLDARRGGFFWTKGNQPERRLARLREAKEVYGRLAQTGQEQAARIWLEREMEKGSMDKGTFTETPDSSLLLPFTEDIQNHAFEMLISGYEDVVFSNPAVAQAHVKEKRAGYQQALLPMAKLIHARSAELNQLLDSEKYTGLFKRRSELRQRLRPFIGGLLEGKENEQQNLDRFGVSSWAEAMEKLKDILDHPEELDQAEVIAAGLSSRIQSLREAGDGVLQPVVERLVDQPEVWKVLSTGTNTEMEEMMDRLLAQYAGPLNYLNSVYFEDNFLMGQMVEETWPKLSTRTPDQWNWKEEFRSLYSQISQHKTDKSQKSLAETVHEILEAKKGIKAQMAPYIADLIQAEGVSFLLNDNDLDGTLQKYVQQIQANEAAMNNFLAANPQEIRVATGFRQYLHTQRFSTPADAFAAGLQNELKHFLELDKQTQRSVYQTKQEMHRRAVVMTDIESKKAAGRQADQDILQLRSLTGVVSPLLGSRETPPTQKEIDKTAQKVAKQYPQASAFVRDCLTERTLAGDSQRTLSKLSSDLTSLSAQLTGPGIEGVPLERREAEAFMTWLVTHHPDAPGQELPQNLSAFREARALVASVAGITITNPVLEAERQQVADALAAGLYTMPQTEFLALANRRLSYLQAASRAEALWTELLKPYEEKQTLYMGLRDYFHTDLLLGDGQLNMDAIRTQAEALLNDETSRQYLINSTSLLGSLSRDSLSETEVAPCTMADRQSFEDFLSRTADEKLLEAYNRLDVAQRQIFALTLTAPGKFGAVLPSSRLLESDQASRSRQITIQHQLQSYINLEHFAPQVNYSLALTRLQGAKGGIDPAAFRQALDFTLLCATRRQNNQPTDLSRLSDSLESRTEARRLLRAAGSNVPEPERPDQLSSVSSMAELLKNQGKRKDQTALVRKMEKLKPHQQQLLIWILQDRTALDFTTRVSLWDVGGGAIRGLVNPDLQADLFTRYADSGHCPQITSQSLSRALDTLYSYQIRDDVDLTNRRLRQEDFVDLDRDSAVDWDLLQRAMDFVQSADRERTRLEAAQNARDYVMTRGNDAAKAQFQIQNAVPSPSVEQLNDFLRTQAEHDGMLEIYAGYLALNEAQRTLFIKALGRRDLLDISKKGITANRFGLDERDYVNPRGRFELIDQHLRHSQGKQGLTLKEDDCRNAILTTLSAQVDDRHSFTREEGDKKHKKPALSGRETAVDWKLVSRALQLVYRATNERDISQEDRELYVSAGDLSKTGTFQFDGGYLRQNIHSAGNRFTRFLGRRVSKRLQEAIPGPAKRLALMLLPTQMANKVNRALGEEEESSINDTAEDFLGTLNDFLDEQKERVTQTVGKKAADKAAELVETASDHLEYVNAGLSIAKNAGNISRLAVAEMQAQQAKEKEAHQPQAAAPQTAEQKALSDRAKERNAHLQEQGASKALSRQTDELVQTVSGIVGGLISDAVGDESGIIEALVEEAGELVNFLRNWLQDKKSVLQYFSRRDEASQLRTALTGAGLPLSEEVTDLNLIRQARGFENETEMASFVGLNIVRSLLFCAGPYNPQNATRVLAVATLTVLGQAEAIGQQDSETAQGVYGALMGGQYR